MDSTPPPANLDTHLGYWLRMVSNAVSQSFARKVENEGVTVAEWVFLRALYDAEPVAPSLLAEKMGMTRGAISKLADRLVEKAMIERRPNRDDKRAHLVMLTDAGRALVPRLATLADENDAQFFGALSTDDRDSLAALLRAIAEDHGLAAPPVD